LPSCVSPADLLARGGPAAEALEQQLLTRLVALNHERAAEEKRGLIRYLRPDYQNPTSAAPQPVQATLQGTDPYSSKSTIQNQQPSGARQTAAGSPQGEAGGPRQSSIINPSSSLDWPADLPAQVAAVRKLLPTVGQDPESLAACFGRKSAKRAAQIAAILATLRALGLLD
jgi:hypothetical protein